MIQSYTDTIMASQGIEQNHVRCHRVIRGWSQAELARRAGVSRTAISAIEIDRLVPSVATALAIAHVFGCSVEALFSGRPEAAAGPDWAWPPTVSPCRYWLAEVRGRVLRFPIEQPAAETVAHDGIGRSGQFQDDPAADPSATMVVAGCDPAAGQLAAEYARMSGLRMLTFVRSGRQALDLLGGGLVHAAGVHFSTDDSSDENERLVRHTAGSGHQFLRIARWDEGLVVARAAGVNSVRDALRNSLRWVGREPGSAARQCLDQLRPDARPPRRIAFDHRGVAEAVRCGWADVGVCHRLAGEDAGLCFYTVRREDYDLCYRLDTAEDLRIAALIKTVRATNYRQLLADLPGFDPKECGQTRNVN
jgi:molybdate-binding protein/DNA-binding XRE family transcriptional regulator